jgi:molybdopterin biosynthesis enzyme
MATVAEADQLILSEVKDFGSEEIYFSDALDRVLAEDLLPTATSRLMTG